jgi:hypothetical protein
MIIILPALEALDNVGVLQLQALGHLGHNLMQLLIAEVMRLCADFAPSNINAYLRVKRLVNLLEAPTPNNFSVPAMQRR